MSGGIIWHWRIGMLGPPWFRKLRWCWQIYWSDDPFVWWSDVKDLCKRLADTEEKLAGVTDDCLRWHKAYMDLKYPDRSQADGEVVP
jgi:hypothetical protein